MDERQEWEAERAQVIRAQQIAREEAAERHAEESRQAEAEARRAALWDAARRTGQPVPSHNDILQGAREASGAEDGWDAAASYGSSTRPAMFVSMPDGGQVEMTAKPAGVARSASEVADDELLRQARESSASSYMRVQIARAELRRRHEASRAGEAAASRHGERDGGREIAR